MALVLDVLLDAREWRSAYGAHKIASGPQRGEFPLQYRKFRPQEPRGTPFDEPHQPMDAKLWVTLHQQMHVIGLDIQAQDLCLMKSTHLTDDLFQPYGDLLYQHLAPILGP